MSRKYFTRRALSEVPIGCVIKGLRQGHDGFALECLADEHLRGVKYPG